MSIKQDIEETYEKYDKLFIRCLDKPLKEFQMSQIRNQFKAWLNNGDSIFHDVLGANQFCSHHNQICVGSLEG